MKKGQASLSYFPKSQLKLFLPLIKFNICGYSLSISDTSIIKLFTLSYINSFTGLFKIFPIPSRVSIHRYINSIIMNNNHCNGDSNIHI